MEHSPYVGLYGQKMEILSTECPRIIVNPKPSLFDHKGIDIPRHVLPCVALDDFVVEDIDQKTWVIPGSRPETTSPVLSSIGLSVAERFRLALVERDARLAPKQTKNARQRQRRTEREWVTIEQNFTQLVGILIVKCCKSLQGFVCISCLLLYFMHVTLDWFTRVMRPGIGNSSFNLN